jgi:hypothetical protein
MDKQISWNGTLAMAGVYLATVNGIILVIGYFANDYSDITFHIIISVMFLLSNFSHGGLVPYEGWLDEEGDSDSNYYKPPENIRYLIIAIVLGGLAYIIFS